MIRITYQEFPEPKPKKKKKKMINEPRVISVNRGIRKELQTGKKLIETGIFKQPVFNAVRITAEGLVDDVIGNKKHHGGKDQALYVYSAEDYQWWSGELGRQISPGTFGENLTLSGFRSAALRIGDRFRINDVLLEMTAPRIPCATLAARMGDPGFVKQFRQARRPGAYARVLNPGALQAGDAVEFIPTIEDHPTILDLFELWYARERDVDLIRSALKAPIAVRTRAKFEPWLSVPDSF